MITISPLSNKTKSTIFIVTSALVLYFRITFLIIFFLFGKQELLTCYLRYHNEPFVTTKDAQQISEAYTINGKDNLKFAADRFSINKNYKFDVKVDTITYSSDSLLCVALLIIKHNKLYPHKDSDDSIDYDGKAIIGCRDSINSPFQIYPFRIFSVSSNSIYYARNDLRQYYFDEIAGKGALSGSNLQGDIYTCGIGDPKFFTEAPNFKRNKFNDYKFKYYLESGEELPYDFPSNKQPTDSL